MLDRAPTHPGTTMHEAGWTEERTETLKKLWLEGHSASVIAGILGGGVSRNGVIGKATRMKLPSHGSNPPKREAKTKVVKKANGGGQPKAAAIRHRLETGSLTPAPLPKPREDEVAAISLLQLNDHTCKWPIGDPLLPDFGFCGQDSGDGSPYCAKHTRRAYIRL